MWKLARLQVLFEKAKRLGRAVNFALEELG